MIPPTWPTPGPYYGTTLNPAPDLFTLIFVGMVAAVLAVCIAIGIAGVTFWIDRLLSERIK